MTADDQFTIRGHGDGDDKDNESYEFEAAAAAGDLDRIHHLYCAWLIRQRPVPETGKLSHRFFHRAAEQAAYSGQRQCLNYLLSRGLKLYGHIVAAGVKSRSIEIMEEMLRHGWIINAPRDHERPPFLGYVLQDLSTVHWFLEHGADPNAPALECDTTPLSFAVLEAPLSTVQLLFEHGGSATRGQLVWHAVHREDAESIPVLQ
ncbi:MAG: hypothetical protein Q9220_007553 [cf. Caloplaca sp. 1 TL-2023]